MGLVDDAEERISTKVVNPAAAIIGSMIDAINEFISAKNIEQKTRLMGVNIRGVVEGGAINDHLRAVYGDDATSLIYPEVVRLLVLYNKSEDGQGIEDIIKLAHAFVLNLKEPDNKDGDRLKAMGGPPP